MRKKKPTTVPCMLRAPTDSMHKLLLVFSALVLFGCSNLPREENAFSFQSQTGVKTVRVSEAGLKRVRSQWTPNSVEVAKTSKLPTEDRQWTLDFIALDTERLTKCHLNDLRVITQRPLREPVQIGNQTTKPTLYHEIWSVDSCNKREQWQINDFDNNLSVVPLQ